MSWNECDMSDCDGSINGTDCTLRRRLRMDKHDAVDNDCQCDEMAGLLCWNRPEPPRGAISAAVSVMNRPSADALTDVIADS